MVPTWAPTTKKVYNTGWGRSRQGSAVTGIWVHHQANGGGGDMVAYMVGANERDSHPTYATDKRGDVFGIVHPDLAPSSTFYVNDQGAVTVEIANVSGAPGWEVPEAIVEMLAQVIAHHAQESPRVNHVERNKPGTTQSGFWVGWHSQVYATACPGPDVLDDKLDRIIARANAVLGGAAHAPEPVPAPMPIPGPASGGSAAPAFPLPSGWYFGPEDGPAVSVSGHHGNKYGTAAQLRKHLWRWQQRMEDRGWLFSVHGSDGLYGDETRENANAFQREKGLVVDGLIGPATWRAAWEEPVT